MYESERKPEKISAIGYPTDFKHIAHITWDTEKRTYKTDNNKSFEEIFNIKDRAVIDKQIDDYCNEQGGEYKKSDGSAKLKETTDGMKESSEEIDNASNINENDTSTKETGHEEINNTIREICDPTNFRHISHISWGQRRDFEVRTNDEQLAQFFRQAGVTKEHLHDRNTREFIFDFIEQHSQELLGMEHVEHVHVSSEPFIGCPSEFTHVTKCIYNKDKNSYDIETKDKHLSWFYERARLLKEQLNDGKSN